MKRNVELHYSIKNEINKCEELIKCISNKENTNLRVSQKIPNLSNLGEKNIQSLNYSQMVTIKNNAKETVLNTENFINKVGYEHLKAPLIDSEDSAYHHFLNYSQAKEEIKKNIRRLQFRRSLIIILSLFLFLIVVYLILKKTTTGDHIEFNTPEKYSNNTPLYSNKTLLL
jgi:hypothetical protein